MLSSETSDPNFIFLNERILIVLLYASSALANLPSSEYIRPLKKYTSSFFIAYNSALSAKANAFLKSCFFKYLLPSIKK